MRRMVTGVRVVGFKQSEEIGGRSCLIEPWRAQLTAHLPILNKRYSLLKFRST